MTNAKKLFDISQADILKALMRGSGFAGGKCRIYAMFIHDHTPKEAAAFLKDEYGWGGCSHDWLDGTWGFIDYSPKGMKFSRNGFKEEVTLTWAQVEQYIRGMVENGVYLTDKDREQLDEIIEQFGCIPDPLAKYGFPKVMTLDDFAETIPEAITLEQLAAMIDAA